MIAFLPAVPTGRYGDDAGAVTAAYAGHAGVIALAAGWFSFVLLGRIVFAVALRTAFRESGTQSAWLDLAVAAMVVSVALEVASFAAVAAAGSVADANGDTAAVVALDAAGSVVFPMIFAPIGVAVLAASVAMLASGLVPRWLGWLGLVAGTLGVVGGVIEPAAATGSGTLADLGALPSGVGAAAFWLWMIATSVVLFRAARAGAVVRAA